MSEADELKMAVNKFREVRGIEPEPESVKRKVGGGNENILIAVPAYGGELKYKMALSLLNLVGMLRDLGYGTE